MDSSTLAILTTIGVPALVAAVAWSIRRVADALGDARVKTADAEHTRASAAKLTAEAERIRAEAARAREETTGRLATSQDERIDDLVERLHSCEAKHEAAEARITALEAKLRERDSAIGALMAEVRSLHDVIASGGVPEHGRLLRASQRFLAALRADGWSPATQHTTEAVQVFETALTSAREAVG